MASTIPARTCYRSSGRVDWPRFLPRALLTFIVALILAALLDEAYAVGWYIGIFMPLLAVLPVAGLAYWTIAAGHCRNVVIATLFGLLAGLVLYLGFYHIGLIHQVGLDNAHRVDWLPKFIAIQKAKEVWVEVGDPNPAGQPDRVQVIFNWFIFAMELALVLLATTLRGWARAGRSYCDGCGNWKELTLLTFRRGSGKEIVEGLAHGDLAVLNELQTVTAQPHAAYTGVAVEFCPKTSESMCPVYFSIREISQGGGAGDINKYDLAFGRSLVNRVRLTDAELRQIAPLYPKLQELLPEGAVPVAVQSASAEAELVRPVTTIEIMPVPEPYRGRVLTTGLKILGNVFDAAPLLPVFGVLAGVGLTVWWLGEQPALDAIELGLGVGGIAFGLAVFFFGLYLAFPGRSMLGHLYLHGRARQEFSQRPDAIVQYDDPEALFVEVVPRRNWDKLLLETASDLGYLRIDERRREILFEGDRERYRIPAAALIDCRIHGFLPPLTNSSWDELFMVAVVVEAPRGDEEIPFGMRDPWGWRTRTRREAWAIDLQSRILGVMDGPVS
jgi:hypothetical protein